MRYQLLALDIDGTLVKEHTNSPSQKVIDAIQSAQHDIHIVLVSARAWKDQKTILDQLKLKPGYHVVENGAKVINPKGTIEYVKAISPSEAKSMTKRVEGLYISVGFCVDGSWLPQCPKSKRISTISFISSDRRHGNRIVSIVRRLPKKYSITVGAHWEHPNWAVTLVSHKDASKGAGLKYIQKKLRISPRQTIAVGDGASDVPTMRYAGVKVAMGNAEPELREVANYEAPSVSEDGVAEVIRRFIVQF